MTSMTSKLKLHRAARTGGGARRRRVDVRRRDRLARVGARQGDQGDLRSLPDLRPDRARRRPTRLTIPAAPSWTANWEQRWPVATCGSINQTGLGVCLSAINATDCTSIIDFLATLGKCEDVDVCVAAVRTRTAADARAGVAAQIAAPSAASVSANVGNDVAMSAAGTMVSSPADRPSTAPAIAMR